MLVTLQGLKNIYKIKISHDGHEESRGGSKERNEEGSAYLDQ